VTEPREQPEYDSARVRFGMLVRGYGQALSRFQSGDMDRDPEPAFYALFEALNWATATDEFVAEIGG
jgi:hypothetical protein